MVDETLLTFEIDGQSLTVPQGSMVIEAADDAGIPIPRFCYHKHLSVAANCRMCLVEVDNSRKPMPACATPVTAGMKVLTQSEKAQEAQQAVMEFLLINHPLDCPICDQGGECELQDVALEYGNDVSRYQEAKRVVQDENIGPLIATHMTRCIHCTRCVRFGEEIAGVRELGATGRGGATRIGTYIEQQLVSEVSGNVIDLCPVGALTAKPSQYQARAWETIERPTIAAHDCLGSHCAMLTRRRDHTEVADIVRTVPRTQDDINACWLSDRDRFAYLGLGQDRLTKPMIKQKGAWQTVDWPTALRHAQVGLQKVASRLGAEALGAVVSPSATTETCYLAQRLMRGLGSPHIDHRLRQVDMQHQEARPLSPGLGRSLASLDNLDACLLIGSDLCREQPLAAVRLRKAAQQGASVMTLGPVAHALHMPVTSQWSVFSGAWVTAMAEVLQAVLVLNEGQATDEEQSTLTELVVSEQAKAIAQQLHDADDAVLMLGAEAQNHAEAGALFQLAIRIAELTGATLAELTEGANSAGAWLAGCVPHRGAGGAMVEAGLSVAEMWIQPRAGYLLLDIEPTRDCNQPAQAQAALAQAEFVLAITPFSHPDMLAVADVILPSVPYTETAGTLINAAGDWQSLQPVTQPLDAARPAWKILRVLGNLLALPGFDYTSVEEILVELKQQSEWLAPKASPVQAGWLAAALARSSAAPKAGGQSTFQRVGYWPMYAIDPIVRRAQALQDSYPMPPAQIRLHPSLAEALGVAEAEQLTVEQAGQMVTLPLCLDATVAYGNVVVPSGCAETAALGLAYGSIKLVPADQETSEFEQALVLEESAGPVGIDTD